MVGKYDDEETASPKKAKEDKFYIVEAVSAFFQGTKKDTVIPNIP